NLADLRALETEQGTPYRVVGLPLPRRRMELEGKRLPLTYANFYVGNGVVVVPTYDDPNDAASVSSLRPLFPGRAAIRLQATHALTGGGAFHCVTQHQPSEGVDRR